MSESNGKRVEHQSRLRWVPIPQMRISPSAQRELNPARVDRIVAAFDPEQIGTPVVNLRDGWFYVIDGQHRVEALKAVGWGDQQVQCWTYEGLTEGQEADTFLKRNDTLAVPAMAKFRVGVTAGRPEETDIDRIVRSAGLKVSSDANGIGAVGTLRRVYRRGGPGTFRRTLHIIRDAYGEPGLSAAVIDGIGYLCQRYNGDLDDAVAVQRLAGAHGGVGGLLTRAEKIRLSTGHQRGQCVAAAAVDVINTGRGGKKLPSWWKA